MEQQPIENIYNILLYLPYETIINYCLTNRQYYNICQDKYFWSLKAYLDFGVTSSEFNNTTLIARKRYLQLLAELGKTCARGSEKVVDINDCLELAIYNDDLSLVKYYLSNPIANPDDALYEAVNYLKVDIVEYLLSIGAYIRRKYLKNFINSLKQLLDTDQSNYNRILKLMRQLELNRSQ